MGLGKAPGGFWMPGTDLWVTSSVTHPSASPPTPQACLPWKPMTCRVSEARYSPPHPLPAPPTPAPDSCLPSSPQMRTVHFTTVSAAGRASHRSC